MKATVNGDLREIPDCSIVIPSESSNSHTIKLKILPEITDSKGAVYNDEPVIGRAFPIKTFSHGENRTVGMKLHFAIIKDSDASTNLEHLRAIQSAVYPRGGTNSKPYMPPPLCQIKCGQLLSKSYLCAVLRSYSVAFDTSVAWYSDENGEGIYLPFKFDVDCNWEIVYPSESLPGQDSIMKDF